MGLYEGKQKTYKLDVGDADLLSAPKNKNLRGVGVSVNYDIAQMTFYFWIE